MEFGKLASTQTSSRQLKNTVGGLILLSDLFRLDRMGSLDVTSAGAL